MHERLVQNTRRTFFINAEVYLRCLSANSLCCFNSSRSLCLTAACLSELRSRRVQHQTYESVFGSWIGDTVDMWVSRFGVVQSFIRNDLQWNTIQLSYSQTLAYMVTYSFSACAAKRCRYSCASVSKFSTHVRSKVDLTACTSSSKCWRNNANGGREHNTRRGYQQVRRRTPNNGIKNWPSGYFAELVPVSLVRPLQRTWRVAIETKKLTPGFKIPHTKSNINDITDRRSASSSFFGELFLKHHLTTTTKRPLASGFSWLSLNKPKEKARSKYRPPIP